MSKKLITLFISLFLIFSIGSVFALTIYDIQYTTNPGGENTFPSPYEDQEVTVTGIITAIDWNRYKDNFFISMPEGGAWNGVLVYMAEDTTLSPGDEVEITGTVDEYYGMTEISGYVGPITVTLLSSGNPIPDPTIVNCADLAPDGVGEPWEGVVVQLDNVTVIQEPDQYGQWLVDDGTGLAQIDDGFFYLDSVEPPIEVYVGQEWKKIIGCLDYSYDEYGVNPRTPDDLVLSAIDGPIENSEFILNKNYPNPFKEFTNISFSLKKPSNVKIEIYNLRGEKIKSIIDAPYNMNMHTVVWEGKNEKGKLVSDGIYFYKMSTDNYSATKKMLFINK